MALIKVVCIQSHGLPDGPGRMKSFESGLEYSIEEAAFAPNLFKKLEDKKKKTEVES